MTGIDRQLRDLLEAAAGEPPHQVSAGAVRRRVSRRRAGECLAGAAAVAVIAVLVPLGIGASGHVRGPAGRHRPPAGPTVYVAYGIAHGISRDTPVVIPISRAAGQAGNPVRVGDGGLAIAGGQIAITPDGKTAYVPTNGTGTVIPISTATNRAGRPINLGHSGISGPDFVAVTPDGKTAYVLGRSAGKHTVAVVTPIITATNTPGKPIYLPGLGGNGFIAITPDGKTAYVTTGYPRAVIPISTATNRAGEPIQIDHNNSSGSQIAITPDGKTAYVVSGTHAVIPVSTVTNTAGQPIQLGPGCRSQLLATPELSIAITPDGKSVYVACEGAVIPVSTKTNTPGQPIRLAPGYPNGIAITGP